MCCRAEGAEAGTAEGCRAMPKNQEAAQAAEAGLRRAAVQREKPEHFAGAAQAFL